MLRVTFFTSMRIEFYRTFIMLMSSNFSIEEALDQIRSMYKKHDGRFIKVHGTIINIINDVYYRYSAMGMTFSEAVKIYIPKDETMLLSSADAKEVGDGLSNVIAITEKLGKVRSAIILSMIKPIIFIVGIIGLMLFSAKKIMPTIVGAIPTDRLPPFTYKFDSFNKFILSHSVEFLVICTVLVVICVYMISRSTFRFRLDVLDKIPPFSIYKKIIAVKFLISLSLLLKSKKNSIDFALKVIGVNANDYLTYYIYKMRNFIKSGGKPGVALSSSTFFTKEISGLLEIYTNAGKLQNAIDDLATDYLDKQIRKIQAGFKTINTVCMLILGAYLCAFMLAIYGIGMTNGSF
ncbi:type II secretion system protein F [Cysteiniphilum litorale]|uniref:Type II secretion system protein F n=2 Tax=Fastidiosibacteraceae TaxID=2056687 RepID=A0A8J2Z309_9GAMM|nr:type II secretion system protein F [Cysteiniphilum litorale]